MINIARIIVLFFSFFSLAQAEDHWQEKMTALYLENNPQAWHESTVALYLANQQPTWKEKITNLYIANQNLDWQKNFLTTEQ